jgi:hypothetical protein
MVVACRSRTSVTRVNIRSAARIGSWSSRCCSVCRPARISRGWSACISSRRLVTRPDIVIITRQTGRFNRLQRPHLCRCNRMSGGISAYRRTVNSHLPILYLTAARMCRFADGNRTNRCMSIFFHIAGLRSPHIMPPPTTGINIIDNSNIVYNSHIGVIMYIVTAHVRSVYIGPGEKGPVIGRRPVTVPGFTNLNIGPYGCPAIISAIFSPGDPRWRPVVPRHPHPSIGIIIKPVAIMKRRPSPVVIGEPGPTV